ncbi:DNA-3-methyladenine glycosylase I [Clostridium grantii]|uniref:DNA-3-methyladenine glycosylase I n=1 Tax=Clostridium grantii DSM 8605 TaxID=1121316 RepID=A0A1M5WQK9_9CLOT|nr:DNA-3-methyladenine glycosylase I [Clostridium grantii]SHH89789.1 DNA-3-methyladenine glycosylase I [Clostridium grantii DSM 8605]
MKRCNWKNLDRSETYKEYHDNEWGVASYGDDYLFEMLILESFHCGLSWLIILNKREAFKEAFDNFNPSIIKDYGETKVEELLSNKEIVRNEAKIRATINNALCFLKVQQEFGTFCEYIWSFTNNQIVYLEDDKIVQTNDLSDKVSKDLKKRGFKFMGSVTTYSYLEAIGIMNNHISDCIKNYKNQ